MRRAPAGPVLASLAVAGALAVAGCSSASSGVTSAGSAGAGTASLATSLVTSGDSWAIFPVSSDPVYWQVLARPTGASAWRLVTPPGVADNGGFVAASADHGGSLTVGVLPSQDLTFSPLTVTSDGGAKWTTAGPVSAALAASPDALAADDAELAALLDDGTILLGKGGSSWQTLAKPGAIAASPAGKGCGSVTISGLSFRTRSTVIAGGTCGTGGTVADFAFTPGSGWQRLRLPVSGQLLRAANGIELVRTAAGVTALWDGQFGWYAYAPLAATPPASSGGWTASAALPVAGDVIASGPLNQLGAWVLAGGHAATISLLGSSKPQWRQLPQVPAHTTVLASGPGAAVDALAVSGATVTVWRLSQGATAWAKEQTISVPIQYGSSN